MIKKMSQQCTSLASYYNTTRINDGTIDGWAAGCGYTNLGYSKCSFGDQARCCPPGWSHVGETALGTSCQPGRYYTCKPIVPLMVTDRQKLNCCLSIGLPETGKNPTTGANGYCAPEWCPNSSQCVSYMGNYCTGANLLTQDCQNWCKNPNNIGKCDIALRNYCGQFTYANAPPVCGCALDNSQYPLKNSAVQTDTGATVPTKCDRKCDSDDAVKLAGQQDCQIGAVCIISNVDISLVQSSVLGSIEVKTECGGGGGSSNDLISLFTNLPMIQKIGIAAAVVILLVLILVPPKSSSSN